MLLCSSPPNLNSERDTIMKALRKMEKGYGHMVYCDVPKPNPAPDEVQIKVLFSGICGSDIHNFKGEYTKVTPLTLGHEFSGKITAIGDNVTDFKLGDFVSCETTFEVCEKCSYCAAEEFNLCSQRKGLGTQVNGSFAEFVIAKSKRCHKLPHSISIQTAAMLEPLACCTHAAMEKTTVLPNEIIGVFGPGPIGLIMSLVLKAIGATVVLIGIDQDTERLQLAKKLGIDYSLNSQQTNIQQTVDSLSNNLGFHQVFECSGNVTALNDALTLVKKKGRIIQVGLFTQDMISINSSLLIHKEIELIGSRTQKPSSWQKAINLLEKKKIDLQPLISHRYALSQWENAFQTVMSGTGVKVLLQP